MVLFRDMNQVTLYIIAVSIILIFLSVRKNPLMLAGAFVQELIGSRKYLLHFAAVIGILFFNKLELWIENHMDYHNDFTPMIYGLEGNFVADLQHLFQNDLLTVCTTFFYVVVFPTLMIVSLGVYTFEKKFKSFYAICYALLINYMVAIPFYLFFPVNEVWSFHPNVKFLMSEVFPTFETQYRPLSGIDNCFPSLHTSISISMAIIALRSKNVFWGRFSLFSALFIIFSIFYLGVHWLTDMCGGLLLGLLAGNVALRISEGRLPAVSQVGDFLKSRGLGK